MIIPNASQQQGADKIYEDVLLDLDGDFNQIFQPSASEQVEYYVRDRSGREFSPRSTAGT
ncbi:MAG: hypothetical protein IPG76_23985 [Acidobacteria bacterium]|nr:hypothetical protein [Acidobacteriota bacterium]